MTATAPTAVIASEDRRARGIAIVLCVALVRLVLYLIAGPNYGYFRDELYYLGMKRWN